MKSVSNLKHKLLLHSVYRLLLLHIIMIEISMQAFKNATKTPSLHLSLNISKWILFHLATVSHGEITTPYIEITLLVDEENTTLNTNSEFALYSDQ